MHTRNESRVATRIGSISDIDRLSEIDLEASTLFERAGLRLDLPKDHEFLQNERNRWLSCLAAGTVRIAVNRLGEDVGFAAVGMRDGQPYLDQLSVRLGWMGQGIGTELLNESIAIAWQAGASALWLTTYNHLSWNRPFYERRGFVLASSRQCGPELTEELLYESRWLPMPEERVVMRKGLGLDV